MPNPCQTYAAATCGRYNFRAAQAKAECTSYYRKGTFHSTQYSLACDLPFWDSNKNDGPRPDGLVRAAERYASLLQEAASCNNLYADCTRISDDNDRLLQQRQLALRVKHDEERQQTRRRQRGDATDAASTKRIAAANTLNKTFTRQLSETITRATKAGCFVKCDDADACPQLAHPTL